MSATARDLVLDEAGDLVLTGADRFHFTRTSARWGRLDDSGAFGTNAPRWMWLREHLTAALLVADLRHPVVAAVDARTGTVTLANKVPLTRISKEQRWPLT